MRGVEGRPDLADDAERAPQGEPAFVRKHRLEIAPVDAGHGDVEQAVLVPGVVDGNDAGVVERRGQPRLAEEALAEVRFAECRREQLQGGLASEPDVLGAVDDARRAAAELLDDPVAAELRPDPPVSRHVHEL